MAPPALFGATHPCAPPAVLTVLRAFPCRTRLGDAEAAGAVEEEVKQPCRGVWRGLGGPQGPGPMESACPRSARACSCGGCHWWAGTTVTPLAPHCPPCTTSMRRWIISSSCRAAAMASSPAWPSSAVRDRAPLAQGCWGLLSPLPPRVSPICVTSPHPTPQDPTIMATLAWNPKLRLSG